MNGIITKKEKISLPTHHDKKLFSRYPKYLGGIYLLRIPGLFLGTWVI